MQRRQQQQQQQRQQQQSFKTKGADQRERDDATDAFGAALTGSGLLKGRQTSANHLAPVLPLERPMMGVNVTTRRQLQAGNNNKDLIIRMLAEIFQVREEENGQLRWQQISASLVPISLYSRTTSRWLDYLLAASCSSQTDDPASTMSPDSRNFLLLLQHFHQQARRPFESADLELADQRGASNESIVFQVVGHDFMNGQCRKILNVKIRQPGTRLGQASDYFVYWRERANQPAATSQQLRLQQHHQQLSGSSFASSISFMPNALNAAQMLNHPASIKPRHNNSRLAAAASAGAAAAAAAADEHQTWGLNFASVNDAKLFYDICSLNLVDLDFNSDYLKQLSDTQCRQQQQQQFQSSAMAQRIPMATTSSPLYSAGPARTHRSRQQQQQQQQQRNLINQQHEWLLNQQSVTRNKNPTKARQSQASRCPSCKQTVDLDQRQSQASASNELGHSNCPVHGNGRDTQTTRMRSRSTSRQPTLKSGAASELAQKRLRSFSTPASPELAQCPVHRRRHRTETEPECDDELLQEERVFQRQPAQRQPKRQLLDQLKWDYIANQSDFVPQKPARGSPRFQLGDSLAPFMRQSLQRSVEPNTVAGGELSVPIKRGPRNRLAGLQQDSPDSVQLASRAETSLAALQQGADCMNKSITLDSFLGARLSDQKASEARKRQQRNNNNNNNNNISNNNPLNRSSFQRAQVEAETMETLARRDARLARARYANSKNMKEFLSLDVGGFQLTPTQRRLQRRHQTRDQEAKRSKPGDNSRLAFGAPDKQLAQEFDLVGRRAARKADDNNISALGSGANGNGGGGGGSSSGNNGESLNQAAGSKQSSLLASGQEAAAAAAAASTTLDVACVSGNQFMTGQSPEANAARCSVSTTTEDLPLDKGTKRRMLKLTSEEVISERTEPRSMSLGGGERAQEVARSLPAQQIDGALSWAQNEPERQVRAVSLGPESVKLERGARSEASRRRSLERSMCVDLDASLPVSSLANSDGSRLAPGGRTRLAKAREAASGAFGGASERRSQAHDCLLAEPHQHQLERRPLLGVDQGALSDGRTPLEVCCENSRSFDCSRGHKMSTFKSVPDIRTVEGDSFSELGDESAGVRANNGDSMETEAAQAESSGRYERQDFLSSNNANETPWGRSNVSSYAVPLCTAVKRPYQSRQNQHWRQQEQQQQQQQQQQPTQQMRPNAQRQCQSCPNSLRRKRAPPVPASGSHLNPEVGQNCPRNLVVFSERAACCACHNCRRFIMPCLTDSASWLPNSDLVLHNQCNCGCLAPPSASACFVGCPLAAAHESRVSSSQHQQHHVRAQQQQHASSLCHCDRVSYHQHCKQHAQALSCSHQEDRLERAFRPHSSQSNRSALHYGLYESECEDELAPAQEEEESEGGQQEPLGRSQSAYFGRAIMKPVHGYDQTLARASLKSRQRSRSQPPKSSADARNSFHLTKSMENVEKLIKEVQIELKALKRQPLGAAQIDLTPILGRSESNLNTGIGLEQEPASGGGGGGGETEISLEEADGAHRIGRQNKTAPAGTAAAKFSYSSATRRAGEFKCVGAIRKAGFLSVKKWILKRNQSIELARKQGWKRYWVCLRGTALLFHSVVESKARQQTASGDEEAEPGAVDLLTWIQTNCSSQTNLMGNLLQAQHETAKHCDGPARNVLLDQMGQYSIEKEPKHLIIIDGSIAQPIPEHPRRDFVFCLSTTFGDAYLFQASCQLESDTWISAIHNACAASIARDLTRDEAIKLFETKVRQFELEAEKKIFLRQRLDSRLTSMASMCHTNRMALDSGSEAQQYANTSNRALNGRDDDDNNKLTMRALLHQLNQQMLALDTYIEQIHCEVYQLRCYLSSCGAQNIFYQDVQQRQQQQDTGPAVIAADLPHPKSLLMHVSKPTKLLLIKLGIFTVSSFHAYIHARQDSAKTILQQIQRARPFEADQQCSRSTALEIRIRSHSISEGLRSRTANVKLDNETEDLLEMANLKTIGVRVSKTLASKIVGQVEAQLGELLLCELSDDRCSIEDFGQNICLNMKVNPGSSSSSIVIQVLKILAPHSAAELDFLNYYLRLAGQEAEITKQQEGQVQATTTTSHFYVIKRKETLDEWSNCSHVELMEKMIFRVELTRSRLEEEAASAPFGISVEGQLFTCKNENLLNVYCSYIEWGSAADKAGLQDEDELLLINGIPVGDLDLMFVECMIQDANKLRAVVRSKRLECPSRGTRLDPVSWRSLDEDDDGGADRDAEQAHHRNIWAQLQHTATGAGQAFAPSGSQVISDAYLSSLVCPPPPVAKSSALFQSRTGPIKLRQKSDLGPHKPEPCSSPSSIVKSESQLLQVSSDRHLNSADQQGDGASVPTSGSHLAKQLPTVQNQTERVPKLVVVNGAANETANEAANETAAPWSESHAPTMSESSPIDQNWRERLQKSILELVETEYAYIKHLETIIEHYMSPLQESDFLDIGHLKTLNRVVVELHSWQRVFFEQLSKTIARAANLELHNGAEEELERLDGITQKIEVLSTVDEFRSIVSSIADLFQSEADNFKLYASYCAAYSRFQQVLHPKWCGHAANLGGTSIISIPSALNSFSSCSQTNGISSLAPFGAGQQRDSRLIHLAESSRSLDQSAQLRQLVDFLASLDSSSSSASVSLAKSSADYAEAPPSHQSNSSKAPGYLATAGLNQTSSGATNSSNNLHKNLHQQNFESYLIKPIQRLVKYPMLLNSIVSALETQSGQDDADAANWHKAIEQTELVVNHVNEAQRVNDEYRATFNQIELQFAASVAAAAAAAQQATESDRANLAPVLQAGHQRQAGINLDISQLLYSGAVVWLNVAEFSSKAKKSAALNTVVFVFSSCVILICKERSKGVAKRKTQPKHFDSCAVSGGGGGGGGQPQASSLANTPGSTGSANCESVCEIVRYQTLIPVNEVQVRSLATDRQSSSSSAGFQWELFQCSSSNSNSSLLAKTSLKRMGSGRSSGKCSSGRRYHLSSGSNEERNTFLRRIRLIIRESVRNMSLPLARSPSSKSLESKKFSISSATSANSNTNIHSSLSQATSLSPVESAQKKIGAEAAARDSTTENAPYSKQAPQSEHFNGTIQVNS